MDYQNFYHWLAGYIKIADPKSIPEAATQEIKNHIKLVESAYPAKSPFPQSVNDTMAKDNPFSVFNGITSAQGRSNKGQQLIC